ncbi:MAG TPA: hypothetical protein VIH61_05765 [Waddliaceae bacterium]
MSNPSAETEEFVKNFKKDEEDEIILWSGDGGGVGFTILRNYPKDIPFVPAKNKDGDVDSVCMIKIGFLVRPGAPENEEVKLFVTTSKVSRYLLNNHWNYDFNDDKSPTKDSLEESKKSKQPIDLEDLVDYIYNKNTRKIFNVEKEKKEVSLNYIVDKVFKLHLKTVSPAGLWFRTKIFSKNIISNLVEPIKISLLWFLDFFLGKTIQSDGKTNFGIGLIKPYKHNSLYSLADEQVDLFKTGIVINKKSAIVVASLVFLMTLISIYCYSPLWWSELKTQIQIVQFSFLLVLVFTVDYIIPHTILVIINLLIKFRSKMWNWKVRIL